MAIRLYRSNRTEVLAARLGDLVAEPLPQPLATETIAVQGRGMERWLAMTLCQRFGVWANAAFPFPRTLLEQVLQAGLGAPAGALSFDAEDLGWAVSQVLYERRDDPTLGHVARYLGDARQPDAWLALGMRLGEVFDRYLLYRPDTLLEFEAGTHTHFQAVLWRALVERFGNDHLARRAANYLALAESRTRSLVAHAPDFPARISLFGVSALPPLFLRVLTVLSREREVHLFALSPCKEYWGDLRKHRVTATDAAALLTSIGRLSRDFQELLEEPGVEYVEQEDLFVDPGVDTLLHGLQSDMLHLHSRGPGTDAAPLPLGDEDRSLRIHDCHSHTRELEVLRDQLRELFERDTTLTPRDVVVMAPDIEAYAPAIEAVFDAEPDALPYRVSDRDASGTSEIASSALAILDLCASRLSLSELSDLLHRPLVHARFGLSQLDLPLLLRWLEDAGARWGLDAAHREQLGQPADGHGSLSSALQALVLGHAMADDPDRDFRGVVPQDDVEGEAERLEGLLRFTEALELSLRELSAPRSAAQWAGDVARVLDRMLLDTPEVARDRQALLSVLSRVGSNAERGLCETPITLHSFQHHLTGRLNSDRQSHGFLHGGITFCRHVPMRALPFRVICLLGMDDESFPRRVPEASFDEVAARPRRGDRTPADDDRQVFLEALLCARDFLIITHRGRTIEDEGVRPRAAVVDLLLRVVDQGWAAGELGTTLKLAFDPQVAATERVILRHGIWAFDARYFTGPSDGEFFTYDPLAARARNAALAERSARDTFIRAPLPPRPRSASVTLEELTFFLRNPSRAFLRSRLNVVLPRTDPPLPDREPATLAALDRWRVAEALRTHAQQESPTMQLRLSAQGLLPLGDAGRYELSRVSLQLSELRARAAMAGAPRSERIDLDVAGVRLVGQVEDVYPDGRSELIVSTVAAKHRLGFWVRQLALCAQRPLPGKLVGRKGSGAVELYAAPIENALGLLEALVELYQCGQVVPLPLYPEASYKYAALLAKGESNLAAEVAADQAFNGASALGMAADSEAPELVQLYGYAAHRTVSNTKPEQLPDALSFESLAERVFGPLLLGIEEVK